MSHICHVIETDKVATKERQNKDIKNPHKNAMDKRLEKEELNTLRKNLPDGALSLLADKTGLKESSIKQILLKPERFNKRVIEQALSLALLNKVEVDQIKDNIKLLAL